MCKDETNDKACCCCGPSYIGVIVFGVLTAIALPLNIVGLIWPSQKGWDGKQLSTEELEANYATALFSVVMYAIVLIPFMLVLIMRKSLAARLALFTVSLVALVVSLLFNVMEVLRLWAAAGVLAENPADEYQALAGRLFYGGLVWLIMTLVIILVIDPLILYVYWKFYTNLRDRK